MLFIPVFKAMMNPYWLFSVEFYEAHFSLNEQTLIVMKIIILTNINVFHMKWLWCYLGI